MASKKWRVLQKSHSKKTIPKLWNTKQCIIMISTASQINKMQENGDHAEGATGLYLKQEILLKKISSK